MRRRILAATFCLLVTTAGAQTSASVAAANKPRDAQPSQVILPELELRGTLPVVFATLLREAGLSGGVALPNQGCSHGPEASITVPAGTTLDKALWQVAKSRAASEWQLRDGVANLLPAGFVPPLLKAHIKRFEWDRAAPLRETVDRLRHLPEVSEEALKLGLREAPFEGGMGQICIRGDCTQKPKPAPALEVEEDATLLNVLNRVVHAHDRAIWDYSEYRCDENTQFSLSVLAE